jgi:hypothetical protein
MTIRLACPQRRNIFRTSTYRLYSYAPYPATPKPRPFARLTQDEDRENAVDLPLSKLHPSPGVLINLELWNSFSETILEEMPDLKPK